MFLNLIQTSLDLLSPFIVNWIINFLEEKNEDTLYVFELLASLVVSQSLSYII